MHGLLARMARHLDLRNRYAEPYDPLADDEDYWDKVQPARQEEANRAHDIVCPKCLGTGTIGTFTNTTDKEIWD